MLNKKVALISGITGQDGTYLAFQKGYHVSMEIFLLTKTFLKEERLFISRSD